MVRQFNNPMDALRYHVSGAVERGDSVSIVAMPTEEAIQWQLERMDYTRDAEGNWIEGEATRDDAIAVLTGQA